MENSIKRSYSKNQLTTIYKVFQEKPHSYSSGVIRPEINAKESLDFFEAERHCTQLEQETENINIIFEKLLVNENNEIVYTELISSKTYNY